VYQRAGPGGTRDFNPSAKNRDAVSHPVAVVERIYRRIGMPMTDDARSRIQTYMNTHPREGRPKHEYTLEQFGFTQEEINDWALRSLDKRLRVIGVPNPLG